jgi:hypothetical protein
VSEEDLAVHRALLESSWRGLLPALSHLLRVAKTPGVIEPICKALTSLIRVCGVLQLSDKRNVFVNVLCTACVPEGLSSTAAMEPGTAATQLMVVGQKELMCAHAMMNAAICLGGLMSDSWLKVLDSIQLLVALVDPPNPTSGASHVQFPPIGGNRPGHQRAP